MDQLKSDKKDAFCKKVGQLLSYAKEKKLFRSKVALAELMGISRSMLYAYMDGSQEVSDLAIEKLNQAEICIRQSHNRLEGILSDQRHAGMVAESSSPYGERTDWQDVEAYVRALKLTHRQLSPEEVLEVLRDEFPIGPEKKT